MKDTISIRLMSILYAVGHMLTKEGKKNPLAEVISSCWEDVINHVAELQRQVDNWNYDSEGMKANVDRLTVQLTQARKLLAEMYTSDWHLAKAFNAYDALYRLCPSDAAFDISNDQMRNIANLYVHGNKILAIKAIREVACFSKVGLREAKETVEKLYDTVPVY